MKPAALALTCKDAMLVFAQAQTLELQKKVDWLELEIYHRDLSSLKLCMEEFNQRNSRCFCLSCIIGERADENDADCDLWRATHADHERCCFKPEWETYLARIGATVNPPSEWPNQINKYGFGFADTPAAVWTIARRDWVFAGWGRPLSSMNSPRKQVWETIIRDCLTDDSSSAGYAVDENDLANFHEFEDHASAALAVEA
jgi:hypothetical protein